MRPSSFPWQQRKSFAPEALYIVSSFDERYSCPVPRAPKATIRLHETTFNASESTVAATEPGVRGQGSARLGVLQCGGHPSHATLERESAPCNLRYLLALALQLYGRMRLSRSPNQSPARAGGGGIN